MCSFWNDEKEHSIEGESDLNNTKSSEAVMIHYEDVLAESAREDKYTESPEKLVFPESPINDRPSEEYLDCILLVSYSVSMTASRREKLKRIFEEFFKAITKERPENLKLSVCVMSYSDEVNTELDFVPAAEYRYNPTLEPKGYAVFNKAIAEAIRKLDARRDLYRSSGLNYRKPIIFVLSDGYVSDEDYSDATRLYVQTAISKHKVSYIPMGIGYTNFAQLQSYYPKNASVKQVLHPDYAVFREIIDDQWFDSDAPIWFDSESDDFVELSFPPIPKAITVEI